MRSRMITAVRGGLLHLFGRGRDVHAQFCETCGQVCTGECRAESHLADVRTRAVTARVGL
jgi:hypothetical protein